MKPKVNIAENPSLKVTQIKTIYSQISRVFKIINLEMDNQIFPGDIFESLKLYYDLIDHFNNNINIENNDEDLFEQYKHMTFPKNFLENKILKWSEVKCEDFKEKKEKISSLQKIIDNINNDIENEFYSVDIKAFDESEDESNVILKINNKVYLCRFYI